MEITINLSGIVFYIGLFTTICLFMFFLHREAMANFYIKEQEILLQEKEVEYKAMYDKRYIEILSSSTKEVGKTRNTLEQMIEQ